MDRNWTPESHVTITDDGMVIEIELDGILKSSLRGTPEKGQLCVCGQHKEFGEFEIRFEISADYSLPGTKVTLEGRRLRPQLMTLVWTPSMGKEAVDRKSVV